MLYYEIDSRNGQNSPGMSSKKNADGHQHPVK